MNKKKKTKIFVKTHSLSFTLFLLPRFTCFNHSGSLHEGEIGALKQKIQNLKFYIVTFLTLAIQGLFGTKERVPSPVHRR